MQCTTGRITVCHSKTPFYDVQSLTCEAELFFQNTGNYSPCRRRIFYRYMTPLLQRHGSSWVYHFPTQRQVTIRCPNGNSWKVYEEFSPKPVSYTMLPSAPSRPTSFEHCLNSTEVPTRCWTPLPCIYRRCH